MKIDKIIFDKETDENRLFRIRFIAENQEESNQLVELGAAIKKPNELYGKVSTHCTWAWLFIPLTKRTQEYFGN